MINTIAHQWRQPLAIINTIVAISKEKLLLNRLNTEELQNKLQDIEANTTYMSNTIEDFLQFHKPTKDKELFSINEMLKSVLNIMNPSLQASQIIIDLNFENNISILGFQRELSQVILALIANARDALVYKDIKSPWIKINAKSDGEYILITIEDNAGGIDENMLLKVFEPYFSTKENKQGSGLGLYISKMIIESSMSGNIDIVNTKNGAKFRIKVKK
jgi:C4-dicarboxylate-specific signal transduction histidine kinase